MIRYKYNGSITYVDENDNNITNTYIANNSSRGRKRICVKYHNSTTSYGLTTDVTASEYSPKLRYSGSDLYFGRINSSRSTSISTTQTTSYTQESSYSYSVSTSSSITYNTYVLAELSDISFQTGYDPDNCESFTYSEQLFARTDYGYSGQIFYMSGDTIAFDPITISLYHNNKENLIGDGLYESSIPFRTTTKSIRYFQFNDNNYSSTGVMINCYRYSYVDENVYTSYTSYFTNLISRYIYSSTLSTNLGVPIVEPLYARNNYFIPRISVQLRYNDIDTIYYTTYSHYTYSRYGGTSRTMYISDLPDVISYSSFNTTRFNNIGVIEYDFTKSDYIMTGKIKSTILSSKNTSSRYDNSKYLFENKFNGNLSSQLYIYSRYIHIYTKNDRLDKFIIDYQYNTNFETYTNGYNYYYIYSRTITAYNGDNYITSDYTEYDMSLVISTYGNTYSSSISSTTIYDGSTNYQFTTSNTMGWLQLRSNTNTASAYYGDTSSIAYSSTNQIRTTDYYIAINSLFRTNPITPIKTQTYILFTNPFDCHVTRKINKTLSTLDKNYTYTVSNSDFSNYTIYHKTYTKQYFETASSENLFYNKYYIDFLTNNNNLTTTSKDIYLFLQSDICISGDYYYGFNSNLNIEPYTPICQYQMTDSNITGVVFGTSESKSEGYLTSNFYHDYKITLNKYSSAKNNVTSLTYRCYITSSSYITLKLSSMKSTGNYQYNYISSYYDNRTMQIYNNKISVKSNMEIFESLSNTTSYLEPNINV